MSQHKINARTVYIAVTTARHTVIGQLFITLPQYTLYSIQYNEYDVEIETLLEFT